MKIIRFYMLHPYAQDSESAIKYLQIESLKDEFEFVWDSKKPDYLITSELIGIIPHIRKEYTKIQNVPKITICFNREAVTPDFNLCDYAIGFDSGLKYEDRFVQLPTAFDIYPAFNTENKNSIDSEYKAKELLTFKTGFCNFLYSNYMAHPYRDQLFYALSKYKRVDSLGRHLNNTAVRGTGYKGHENSCITIKNPYKFSIASENAKFSGYTSEKIITSLVAHTVPIYFGNPNVTEFINPDCFVNCNDYMSIDEVVEKVKEIDENDDLWCKMISAPWQTPSQIRVSEKRKNDYVDFFRNIFQQDISKAKRKGEGCHIDAYRRQFFHEKIHTTPLITRAYRRFVKSYLHK